MPLDPSAVGIEGRRGKRNHFTAATLADEAEPGLGAIGKRVC
jgi:hypothetical protein